MSLTCSLNGLTTLIAEQYERNQSAINLAPVDVDVQVDDIKVKIVLQNGRRDIMVNFYSADLQLVQSIEEKFSLYYRTNSPISHGYYLKKFKLRQFESVHSMYCAVNNETNLQSDNAHFPIRGYQVKIRERVAERAMGLLRQTYALPFLN